MPKDPNPSWRNHFVVQLIVANPLLAAGGGLGGLVFVGMIFTMWLGPSSKGPTLIDTTPGPFKPACVKEAAQIVLGDHGITFTGETGAEVGTLFKGEVTPAPGTFVPGSRYEKVSIRTNLDATGQMAHLSFETDGSYTPSADSTAEKKFTPEAYGRLHDMLKPWIKEISQMARRCSSSSSFFSQPPVKLNSKAPPSVIKKIVTAALAKKGYQNVNFTDDGFFASSEQVFGHRFIDGSGKESFEVEGWLGTGESLRLILILHGKYWSKEKPQTAVEWPEDRQNYLKAESEILRTHVMKSIDAWMK